MITSPDTFFIFSKFCFCGLLMGVVNEQILFLWVVNEQKKAFSVCASLSSHVCDILTFTLTFLNIYVF